MTTSYNPFTHSSFPNNYILLHNTTKTSYTTTTSYTPSQTLFKIKNTNPQSHLFSTAFNPLNRLSIIIVRPIINLSNIPQQPSSKPISVASLFVDQEP
ncbi:hypothetical protein RYX36_017957 [Vicia faba]